MMQLTGTRTVRTRPLLALAAVVTVGLSFWGSDEGTDPGIGLSGVAEARTVAGMTTDAARSARQAIAFPERTEAADAEPGLFSVHSWHVAPPPVEVKPAPPPAPTAPPLPFTYLGSFTPDGSPTVYYLVKGDRILDVHIGDTLEGTYTVDTLQDDQLVLTYTPLQQKQTLNLSK